MRFTVVVGARPNFVKVGPLIPEMESAGHEVDVAFTGSREADRASTGDGRVTFYGVAVPPPKWFLDIGVGAAGVETGRALMVLEDLFEAERPEAVLVVGDVNTTLAASIAAAKLHIPVVHLEAGLRCGELCVAEEVNRVLISRLASVHLAPTEAAFANLEAECVDKSRIHFVGSIMAESVLKHLDEIRRLDAAGVFGLTRGEFALAVIHRDENVLVEDRLAGIMAALGALENAVLIPDAEGLRGALSSHGIGVPDNVFVVDAVGYREMLALQRDAEVVVTDSGGIQEEACMVGTPCVTIRTVTEHVSTVAVGANRLSDATVPAISAAIADARSAESAWVAPKRWDKAVSGRIVRALKQEIVPLT